MANQQSGTGAFIIYTYCGWDVVQSMDQMSGRSSMEQKHSTHMLTYDFIRTILMSLGHIRLPRGLSFMIPEWPDD